MGYVPHLPVLVTSRATTGHWTYYNFDSAYFLQYTHLVNDYCSIGIVLYFLSVISHPVVSFGALEMTVSSDYIAIGHYDWQIGQLRHVHNSLLAQQALTLQQTTCCCISYFGVNATEVVKVEKLCTSFTHDK